MHASLPLGQWEGKSQQNVGGAGDWPWQMGDKCQRAYLASEVGLWDIAVR